MLCERVTRWLLAVSICAGPALASAADETSIVLAEGEGRGRVQAMCSMCHSLDYIVINSRFQDRTAWERTVRKMVNVMGAPLTDEDVTVIANYLAAHYGVSSAPFSDP